MKILLTGPCGRMGYTTCMRLLEAGYDVRCFDTKNNYSAHPEGFNESIKKYLDSKNYQCEWQWGDIRNIDDVKKAVANDIDVIIHHAAMTLPSQCEEEWETCWETNYQGTLNVIEAIQASSKAPKLIFSSSVANYGYQRPDNKKFSEEDNLPATCTYAATKIASEIAIKKSGIQYNIMRMASAIDFQAPHIYLATLPFMAERIIKENKLKTPSSPAHFVSVDDVNTAYLSLINDTQSVNSAFNIAGPEDCCITFKAFQDELAAMLGMETSDDDWGEHRYPQYYYDIASSDAALKYVNTNRQGLVDNMLNAINEMEAFMNITS